MYNVSVKMEGTPFIRTHNMGLGSVNFFFFQFNKEGWGVKSLSFKVLLKKDIYLSWSGV